MRFILCMIICFGFISLPTYAVVTFLNCPTLTPLPVTAFTPTAMLPIKTTENFYDVGMKLIATTISKITIDQVNAASSNYNSIIKSFIKISSDQLQQSIEIDRNIQDMKLAQESSLQQELNRSKSMIFPSDPAMKRLKNGNPPVVDRSSPTYMYVKKLCTAGKMISVSNSVAINNNAIKTKQRRSRKIYLNITAVANVNMSAKNNVDFHYDLFCSPNDFKDNVCDTKSNTPNLDISAYNFLYPVGYKSENDVVSSDYSTIYTYSSVESLAAYQYVKNITGNLFIPPPSVSEYKDLRKVKFIGAYKQRLSALSVSADTLLSITQRREPVNSSGLVMSKLDVLNYRIFKDSSPESTRSYQSMSESGKLLEIQKQLSLSNRLKFLLLQQKDSARILDATNLSLGEF